MVTRQIRISGGLLACILAVFMQVSQVLFLPATLYRIAGQEAWVAVLLSYSFGALVACLGVWVCLRHPGKSLAQIARTLLGKWVGGFVALIYSAYCTWLFSLVLRDILDFTVLVLLPGTPGRVIVALIGLVSLFAVWGGLEAIARVGFQVLMAVLFGLAAVPVLLSRQMGLLQLEPFLYHGLGSVIMATIPSLTFSGDAIVVLSLVPHIKHLQNAYRWTIVGIGAGCLMLEVLVVTTELVFGPDLPARLIFPVYDAIRLISIGNVVERVEVVLVIIWMSGMWLKQTTALYAASESLAGILGVKAHRYPAVGLAVVGVALTAVWRGPLDLIYFSTRPIHWLFYTPAQIGVPLVLLLASLVSRALHRGGSASV
jgi:spore germination protein KB